MWNLTSKWVNWFAGCNNNFWHSNVLSSVSSQILTSAESFASLARSSLGVASESRSKSDAELNHKVLKRTTNLKAQMKFCIIYTLCLWQYKYYNLKKQPFAGQNIHQVALLIALKLMQLCHNVYGNFRLEYQRQLYYRTAYLFQDQY